jgi:anti-sigma B factor antagonist
MQQPVATSRVEPGCSRHLEVHDEISCGEHRLVLVGELDLGSVSEFGEMIERICADSTRGVTVDLGQLTFMDSTGLHGLLVARDRCQANGKDFRILPGQPQVQRLFELTGLMDELSFSA